MTMREAWLRFGAWMIFALILFKSISTVALWWESPDQVTGAERLWVYALPLLVFIHLRYFSKLRCGRSCSLPNEEAKRS